MGTTFCRFKNLKQDINTSNAVKIFQQAASLGHKSAETLKEAQQFIEEHFEKVLKDSSKDFTSLSFELLFQLLVSDKLNITNERPVWEVIKEWVKADMEARLETNLLMLVKKCLRFGRLPEGFVEEFIFSSDLFAALPKSKRNHLIDYMNKILKKKQPKKQTSEILKTTDEHQHCFKPPPYSRSLTPFCPRETKQFLVCLNYNYRQLQTMVEYYDYQLKLWRPSPFFPMPPGDAGIFALQAVDDGQRLFLFGGYAQRVSVAATWTIDLAQPLDNSPPVWTPKCPMLTARHHFSSVQLDGAFLYALGGETQEDCIIADCERYDIATDCWTAIAPMNVARSKAAAAVLGGQIYIAGGCCPVATSESGDKYLTTVEVYDPQTNRWQLVAPMTTARIRFALVPFEGRLWAIAGQTTGRSWLTQLSSCESYDPQTDTWREEPAKLNKEHSSHQAVNFRGQLYLVGGEREYLQTDWTERYEPESKSWLLESPLVFNHLSHQLAVVPANCLAPFITPPPEAVENDAQTESQIKKHFFKFLSLAIAFLAAAVYFCIFGSSTLSQWPGGPLVYIAGFFLFLLICVVALATDFFQIGFSKLNDWQILERLKHPSSLLPFIDRSESLENKKTKYVRGDSCEEYDIKHFYCISLAYYNFEHFNRNIIRKLPYRDDLTKEKIKYIKENFRMGSLEQNKKGVEEFERTLRRAKFTVSKLPEGCKTEADTARFLRKELKQFKYEDKVCLVIYISSHGVDGAFFCEDGLFTVRRLIDQLNLYRALSDSPKVIIVDTCRVREEGGKNIVKNKNPTPPWPTDDIDESLKRQDEWWNPEPFQLLTVFSCLRKYYSYSKDGGLYTLKLTDVLKEHCSAKSSSLCLNLYDLFNIAQDRARAQVVRIDSEECYQVGIVNTQLNYDIILNELEEENEEKMKESKVVEDEENESSEEDEESEEDDEEDDEEDEEDDEESDDYAESDEKPPFEFERFFGSSYSDL